MDKFRPLVIVNRIWVTRRFWVIGGLALLVLSIVTPILVGVSQSMELIQFRGNQLQASRLNLEKLLATKVLLNKELKELGEDRQRVISAAVSQEVITDDQIAYWRKQMDVFGLVKNMSIKIVGRGSSQYSGAIKINVQLTPVANGKPLSSIVIAQALDFLQLYGYVESFDGNTVSIHVKGS